MNDKIKDVIIHIKPHGEMQHIYILLYTIFIKRG